MYLKCTSFWLVLIISFVISRTSFSWVSEKMWCSSWESLTSHQLWPKTTLSPFLFVRWSKTLYLFELFSVFATFCSFSPINSIYLWSILGCLNWAELKYFCKSIDPNPGSSFRSDGFISRWILAAELWDKTKNSAFVWFPLDSSLPVWKWCSVAPGALTSLVWRGQLEMFAVV